MTHTRGPWTVEVLTPKQTESGNAETTITCHADSDGKEGAILATVNRWSYDDARAKPESDANARLIAAAPDLLAALKELVAVAPAFRSKAVGSAGSPVRADQDAYIAAEDAARAAIAKATGQCPTE